MSLIAALLLATAEVFLFPDPFINTSLHQIVRVSGTLRNTGPATVPAELVVELPAGVQLAEVRGDHFKGAWTCVEKTGSVVCTNPSFAATQSYFYDFRLRFENGTGRVTELPVRLRIAGEESNQQNYRAIARVIWRRPVRVTSSADAGPGTLRQAIHDLNAACSGELLCEVLFELPLPATIEPLTPLPPVTACGWRMDPSAAASKRDEDRLVTLSGARLSSGNGLELRTNCRVQVNADTFNNLGGLAIGGFPGNGISFTGSTGAYRIFLMSLGTDATGTQARPNGGRGLVVETPASIRLSDSIISGNTRSGVYIASDCDIDAEGLFIGVGRNGEPLPNGASGVYVGAGRFFLDQNSTVAHHPHFGVAFQRGAKGAIDASVHSNGVQAIDWDLDGPTPNRNETFFPTRPSITDAYFDAARNETVIVVAAPLRNGWPFSGVRVYANRTRNASGRAEMERFLTSRVIWSQQTDGSRVEFRVSGDLRGEIITAVQIYDPWGDASRALMTSSEVSDGVAVR